ncbi:pyridoxal phosphate-dependent transferase [Chytriomyces sp. MP71]|nr:pyridoxal phosphate-dependent transferase [Chytriomyces sp. MP71]
MAPLGESIPAHNKHAVSVSLPTWADNVKYEEGDPATIAALSCGYPRFVYHPLVVKTCEHFEKAFARNGEKCLVFPSARTASECRAFVRLWLKRPDAGIDPSLATSLRVIEFAVRPIHQDNSPAAIDPTTALHQNVFAHIILFPAPLAHVVKMYWQHAGEGISSRFAEHCLRVLGANKLSREFVPSVVDRPGSGGDAVLRANGASNRFQAPGFRAQDLEGAAGLAENSAGEVFVEERFGRNLDLSLAGEAKRVLQQRIAGVLADNKEGRLTPEEGARVRGTEVDESHVYLFPTGMSAIYNAFRAVQLVFPGRMTVQFGFPYTDTLKIQEKFGIGCIFLGHGTQQELDALDRRLASGERISALFCEFPSNPLLKSADLVRIRAMADQHQFLVVVDETIGNFYNVAVLKWADIVVSSLTKIFSGDSNVMGGSAVLNPLSPNYAAIKTVFDEIYEDNMWGEDALFLERNSRNFIARLTAINHTAEKLALFLHQHPKVERVHYPLFSDSEIYAAHRREGGGYGGLLSVIMPDGESATKLYDNLNVAKGPSLGTNFTLASPYTILAHFTELEWAESFGVSARLVRVSVGLESEEELLQKFNFALSHC